MPPLNAPLTSLGNKILDASGQAVRLAGVNWGGAHQDNRVPSGLDRLHRDVLAGRVAAMGFNHVRFPYALGTFVNNTGSLKTGPVDPARIAANPDLAGATAWEVYVECVHALIDAGVAVIPNQHLLFQGMCCSENDGNGLWYNGNWSPQVFADVWQMVAEEFAGEPLVIGYDLHNEPRSAVINGVKIAPTWGDGNRSQDLRLLYHDTIVAMRQAGPGKLYFCEGLSYAQDLTGAAGHPVGTGPGTVYSMHDYFWFGHDGETQAQYNDHMDRNGGYLMTSGQAPVWVSEFGIDTTGPRASYASGWLPKFQAWAQARQVHWCWWQLNAMGQLGTEPTTNKIIAQDGNTESYGLMAGHDWKGTQVNVLDMLRPMMTLSG